ncbi:hypothetical protein FKM82_008790 [Ascaphus truei]
MTLFNSRVLDAGHLHGITLGSLKNKRGADRIILPIPLCPLCFALALHLNVPIDILSMTHLRGDSLGSISGYGTRSSVNLNDLKMNARLGGLILNRP